MKHKPLRRFGIAVTVALAVAGCAKHETPPETIRPVQLTQVTLGAGGDSAVFAGEVKPRHEADLGFRIGGKIVGRYVDVGAKVKRGQVLARLDPADVGLQTEASKAQLAAAETEYNFATAEFERYQTLLDQKFISASALDAKRNTLNANRAKYEQAKAQLAVTFNQASYAALAADQDGVITAVNAEVGQVVTPGQVVVRLARAEEKEVAIAVPENRIDELQTAKEMGVLLWANPAKVYPARVREVAPAVDPATRTFAVRVSILTPDPAMQWGMTANVVVRGDGIGNVAVLPLTALYQQDGKPAVWIYDPGTQKVSLHPVEIGPYREDGVVIRAGLNVGDLVVTAGVHKLTAGQTVRPYEGAQPRDTAGKLAPVVPAPPPGIPPKNSSAPLAQADLRT
jgi:RND family efflux transporter MFP subunit